MKKSNNIIVRNSNFELLRLLAMFGIIVHHLVIKGASTCGYIDSYDYERDGVVGLLLNSFVVGGVNCFILITGWFGIKNVTKPFIRLFFETAIFGFISYMFLITTNREDFSLGHVILSMDFRQNWFVIAYLMLLIVSPILERSLKNIAYAELKHWIWLLIILNIGFVLLLGKLNDNGYNVIQFIFLYYISRFLRISCENHKRWFFILERYSMVLYIMAVLFLTMGYLLLYTIDYQPSSIKWFGYNNPLVIIVSVALFVCIVKTNIRSNIINLLATGVFGVFILHTTKYIIPVRNEFAHNIYVCYGYFGIVLLSAIIFASSLALSIPISSIVKVITSKIHEKLQ